jgi:hypothetical protein
MITLFSWFNSLFFVKAENVANRLGHCTFFVHPNDANRGPADRRVNHVSGAAVPE